MIIEKDFITVSWPIVKCIANLEEWGQPWAEIGKETFFKVSKIRPPARDKIGVTLPPAHKAYALASGS